MANKILIKRAGTQNKVPTVGDLDLAELAINTYDGRLFAKKDVGGTTSVVDLTRNAPVSILGDATSTYAWDQATYTSQVTTTLNTVNATTGTFGGKADNVLTIPVVTVNAKGLVTGVTTTTYSAAADLGTMSTQNANSVAITGGAINGTTIGATTAATGKFTTLDTTGSVVIGGDLTVQGTVTTVNSTTVTIADKNLELATNATNKAAASGGGITVNLGSDGDATINYISATDSWDLNQNTNVTGTLSATGAATVGSLSTTGTLAAGASTLGATTATSLNSTPIGATTASTGAFTTLSASGTVTMSGSATVGANLSVTDTLTVNDLTITGTTSLASISSSSVAATQVVYGGTGGAFKSESDFTYNETTNTISAGGLALTNNATVGGTLGVTGATTLSNTLDVTGAASFAAAVNLTSAATLTLGTYTTGALKLVGDASIAGALQVQGTIYKGGFAVLNTADTIDGGTF